MKILIVKDFPGEIKVEKMTYNIQEIGLAVELRKKGYECDVMSIADDGHYREREVKIDGVSFTLYSAKATVLLKNGWLRGVYSIFDRYDIIHICEYNQVYTWHIAKKYKNKMVCYHGPYYSSFNHHYNLMAKFFDMFFVNRYRKLNTCFITKSILAKDYLESKGLKNVHPVGVGLSTSFLESNTNEELIPEIENIKKFDSFKLLYIGVLEPRRNSLFLLDIVKKLADDGLKFKMILIGRYKDDEYKREFEDKINNLSISDYIYYIPRLEQKYLKEVYKQSDIFLFPSIYDIYGMVLLESMYFSVPTITSLNGGSSMMVKNNENGIIIDDFDTGAWVDTTKKLLLDNAKRKQIGESAHKTIEDNFTWDALADKFIEIYKSKLGR